MNTPLAYQGFIIIAFIAIMYFMLIRPQKKKEQEVDAMRSSIRTGDEIVSIGGICGKVVKVKEESIIIQVGADKVKFELKKWAVSSVEKKAEKSGRDVEEPADVKKPKPKRLGKKDPESMEAELKESADEVKEALVAPEEAIPEEVEIPQEAVVEEAVDTINQ